MHAEEAIRETPVAERGKEWWRGAAIYQIYPRSFADSDGDGIGDLRGITGRLDYVASLGVDAIWLSPFFTSPMRDFGYDVADFCDVDPVFGTLADFDALLKRAHELGLRVIIDQVYSHSSDQHAWFAESRSSRDNPRADWYVWHDPKPDGSPPNNWQSVFGGPAWEWDSRRSQYYLHNFLPEQPDLNLHNPAVQDAILGVAQFWLDRGVDGFRIDAVNFAMHDPQLHDNPPAASGHKGGRPFDFQQHLYNQSHPDIPKFLERVKALANHYPDRFLLAEVGGDRALQEMLDYTRGDGRLDSAYSFDFLYADRLDAKLVCQTQSAWPDSLDSGWPCFAFENHDSSRAVSRWQGDGDASAFLAMKMALLACLRGSIIIYQGEELGLDQVDIPFDKIRDPEAVRNWPLTLSRDGARTPFPWSESAQNAGFSRAEPWLPLGPGHAALAQDAQERDPQSLMNLTRRLLMLRQNHPALRSGTLERCTADGDLLTLERAGDGETITCRFNLGGGTRSIDAGEAGSVILALGGANRSSLPPYAVLVTRRP
ncbi:DUF3459 domain-containing protein [Sphingomonas sabuli]|uniref:DUF3459 domain-containing protein n=1 Tax=Sphingomonas sabuli TaxID=2764186 RepID=A0A7G9KZT0_9SPHN|nr:alpha-amylase family glycosyl hydrolase [Sphingomonas sabuli]QNM81879.1 DUF3459 domain-containing protein [Sphingomonas sabuli]